MSSVRGCGPLLPEPKTWDPYVQRSSYEECVRVGGRTVSRRAVGTLLVQLMQRVEEKSSDYLASKAGVLLLADGCPELDDEIALIAARQLQQNGGRLWPGAFPPDFLRQEVHQTLLTSNRPNPSSVRGRHLALKPPAPREPCEFSTPGDHGQHRAQWAPYSENTE